MDERVAGTGPFRTGGRPSQVPGTVQLASREDFRLGLATIRPSLRTVEGPQGSAVIEPRVMQVLVAFADAGGAVLTRDDLMRRCWGGSIVSEDAVNRTVAEIRRIARQTGGGFGIGTIPRVGYRLEVRSGAVADAPAAGPQEEMTSAPPAHETCTPTPEDAAAPGTVNRRRVAGGLAAAALGSAAFVLGWRRPVRDPVFDEAIAEGLQQLMMEYPGKGRKGVEPFTLATGR